MATRERRSREREHRERQIIDGARDLFIEKGYAQTTMDDIVRALELSKGGLYHHFQSKDELLYATATAGMELMKDMIIKEMAPRKNGLEKVTAVGEAYVRFHLEQPGYRKLFGEMVLASPPEGPRGLRFARLSEETGGLMVEAIEEGIKDGSIRPDISPRLLAFSASSSLEGVLSGLERRVARLKGDRLDQEEVLSFTFNIFRTAISTGK